jgi:hypothetical protein
MPGVVLARGRLDALRGGLVAVGGRLICGEQNQICAAPLLSVAILARIYTHRLVFRISQLLTLREL